MVFVVALIVLVKSADYFVVAAARLALQLRVSAVVVGAVVIGFGTSLPELLVSGFAAAEGEADIAFGNVVGSNVANMSLVLGAAAVFGALRIASTTLRREAPLAVAAVIALGLLAQGDFTRMEGVVLIVGLVAALGWIVVAGRGDATLAAEVEEFVDSSIVVRTEAIRCGLGMVGTMIGAQALVWSATSIATDAALSGGLVGFTLVAVGTSLPELVTSYVAARRNEADLVIGNLLGSNLFNSLAVGAVIALIAPGPIGDSTLVGTGVVFMVVVAVGSWFLMITGSRVVRWEGLVLLSVYVGSVIALSTGSADEHAPAPDQSAQTPDPERSADAPNEATASHAIRRSDERATPAALAPG